VTTETIPSLLVRRASDSAQVEAIVDHDSRLTYAELEKLSRERATWLVGNGVNKGHRVGLLMPNRIEWAINAYAVMRIGAVLIPLSTFLRPAELCAQLAVAGVRHLIAVADFRGRNYQQDIASIDRSTLPSLRNIWWARELGSGGSEDLQAVTSALSELVRPANDMAIIFTSGSSGMPKGVVHTHGGAIRANAAGLADRCVQKAARLYLPMPFFWVGGFAGGLISALNAGATLLTEAIPEPGQTLKFLQRERVTLFRGWPDQAAQLASHPDFAGTDLSHLTAGSLDALLPAPLRSTPARRANLFGMTETFGPFCGYALDKDMPADKAGSCGKPFAGIEVRIVAVDNETGSDNVETLPAGAVGSIQLGGRNILRGICGREREEIFTADGWYDGGDLGWLDDDGFLHFAGRKDDMIKVRGVTLYPAEVESALESLPQVQRAIAIDISIDNAKAMGAAIIPQAFKSFDLEQLRGDAAAQLSAFKMPSRWIVFESLNELPRMATGKIDKPRLRQLLQNSKS
jgi:acyl-CoA synthetase (AMP-forming)/AMP-acid ligase II